MRRARARRRRALATRQPNETLEIVRVLASPVSALVGGIAAMLIVALGLERGWTEALSTGASVAFLTFLVMEVPNMVLNYHRVRAERDARMEAETRAVAAEAKVEVAEARAEAAQTQAEAAQTQAEAAQTQAEAAQTQAEAARRRSDRLAAALVAALKDKGVDPQALDALLDE